MHSEEFTPLELTEFVANVVRGFTFRFTDEKALQDGLELAFGELPLEREFNIDARSRIDFLIALPNPVGVEVKVSQSPTEVARQVRRYLKSDKIDGLVLVTTRRRHRKLEQEEFDKPVEIVWLGSSGF